MKDKFSAIKTQSKFCADLMSRLDKSIQGAGERMVWGGMENHTQKQNDIVRLRRELRVLFVLLDPWMEENEK